MRDQHRLRGGGDSFRGRAIAAVTEIDGHSDLVHFLDGREAGLAQPSIPRFEAAIAKNAPIVVGELHDAHAKIAKQLNSPGILLEKRRVLKTGKNAELPLLLGKIDSRMLVHDRESVLIFFNERLERREVFESSIKSAFRDRAVKGGYSRLPNRGEK